MTDPAPPPTPDLPGLLRGAAILLAFLLAGEIVGRLLPVPIPGSAVGLALLWAALGRGWVSVEAVRAPARGLLALLPLLFVPGGAGIVASGSAREWLVAVPVTIVITLVGIAVTAWAVRR